MTRRGLRRAAGAALPALLLAAPAAAQGPTLRARLEPPQGVMVGEPARLVVDVLTPTWFLAAPRFPTLRRASRSRGGTRGRSACGRRRRPA